MLAWQPAHQTPSAVFIAFVGIAVSKHKGEDGFQEVHALPSLLPHAPPPHVVGVQVPEHIGRAEPDPGASVGVRIAVVVAAPARTRHSSDTNRGTSCVDTKIRLATLVSATQGHVGLCMHVLPVRCLGKVRLRKARRCVDNTAQLRCTWIFHC